MVAQVNDHDPSGGSPDQHHIQQLVSDLGSMNDHVRFNARRQLIHLGKPAEPALIHALQHANHLIRWGAVKALTEMGDPAIAPIFVQVLEDDVFDIRWIASEGIISLGISGVVPLLQALMEHPEIPSLREGARHVVHVLSQMGMGSILEPLVGAMDSIHPATTVPPAARYALDAVQKLKE
jgi:HEAT repeat protein